MFLLSVRSEGRGLAYPGFINGAFGKDKITLVIMLSDDGIFTLIRPIYGSLWFSVVLSDGVTVDDVFKRLGYTKRSDNSFDYTDFVTEFVQNPR